ncbi:Hypothetical_protein [Hexamita inflata]|uniref:Hypothetical_protein n=1 Tax=Hexamita inflata TaxID=28002 RepID=A0AA86QRZ6_9EUKA|nr:Hypothetical protein HINF_LOCUS48071 [Hexamita inflata]
MIISFRYTYVRQAHLRSQGNENPTLDTRLGASSHASCVSKEATEVAVFRTRQNLYGSHISYLNNISWSLYNIKLTDYPYTLPPSLVTKVMSAWRLIGLHIDQTQNFICFNTNNIQNGTTREQDSFLLTLRYAVIL